MAPIRLGSSPLARGLPGVRSHGSEPSRIIPARAGFTLDGLDAGLRHEDHPRSRGVYRSYDLMVRGRDGSSPLARGLRGRRRRRRQEVGIIPARAGFTPSWAAYMGPPQDHPRSRGVYSHRRVGCHQSEGSSPLARGLPHVVQAARVEVGIIPARAGFTRAHRPGLHRRGDHPRSRGVYVTLTFDPANMSGSSPLARGLQTCLRSRECRPGIIPARAGFTLSGHGAHGVPPDHPRSRGVYWPISYERSSRRGSSPLARGLLPEDAAGGGLRRIIPARAGFTGTRHRRTRSGRDHPRSRGVYEPPPTMRPPA